MGARIKGNPNCRKLFFVLALGSFFLIWLYGHNLLWAGEKEYPNQPIKIIVPYAPGGIVDLGARLTTNYVAKELKVPIIIENRAGADGMVGGAMVLRAKPDGYTLLAAGDSPLVSGPLTSPNPPYNPFKDFLPIGMFGVVPGVCGVYSSSPYKTLMDFVKDAKENPGKLNCGVSLIGSSNHITAELFIKYAKVDIKIIPYKGNPDRTAALLGKHIDSTFCTYVALLSNVISGEARILAATRSIPGTTIQTFAEAGFPQPEFPGIGGFLSFQVSINTPKPIYEKLVLSFERVAKNPEFAMKLDNLGLIRTYRNPAEFKEFMKETWLTNSKVLEQLGLKKWQGKID